MNSCDTISENPDAVRYFQTFQVIFTNYQSAVLNIPFSKGLTGSIRVGGSCVKAEVAMI